MTKGQQFAGQSQLEHSSESALCLKCKTQTSKGASMNEQSWWHPNSTGYPTGVETSVFNLLHMCLCSEASHT